MIKRIPFARAFSFFYSKLFAPVNRSRITGIFIQSNKKLSLLFDLLLFLCFSFFLFSSLLYHFDDMVHTPIVSNNDKKNHIQKLAEIISQLKFAMKPLNVLSKRIYKLILILPNLSIKNMLNHQLVLYQLSEVRE